MRPKRSWTPTAPTSTAWSRERGFKTVDVVSIAPDNPQREAMRAKFLDEHFHKEDEVRFFVAGSGLFTLHVGDKVYEIKCEQGDLIAVPDSTMHWFDMGPEPSFVAIRFFTEPDGWVGHFTGTDIAQKFPALREGPGGLSPAEYVARTHRNPAKRDPVHRAQMRPIAPDVEYTIHAHPRHPHRHRRHHQQHLLRQGRAVPVRAPRPAPLRRRARQGAGGAPLARRGRRRERRHVRRRA